MPGRIDKQKQQTLEENGYVYNFRRMIYINHSSKKLFSYEAIRDHDLNWIKSRITENNVGEPRWPPENRPVVAGSKPASGRTVFS